MTEPEFGIKITRDEEEQEYKYAVCIYLNPVIMDSLTYEQQRQFEGLQKRNETLVSQCIDEIGDTATREKASQALDDYCKQITDYIHLAEKQYRAVTTTPEQVSRDIQSSIHNFSEADYRQMRIVEEWEYEYIKEALIGINHPLIEYYKELTGDTTEIPEIFLSPIQEKAKQIYIDLQAALDRLKRNNKEPPKTPQKSKYNLIEQVESVKFSALNKKTQLHSPVLTALLTINNRDFEVGTVTDRFITTIDELFELNPHGKVTIEQLTRAYNASGRNDSGLTDTQIDEMRNMIDVYRGAVCVFSYGDDIITTVDNHLVDITRETKQLRINNKLVDEYYYIHRPSLVKLISQEHPSENYVKYIKIPYNWLDLGFRATTANNALIFLLSKIIATHTHTIELDHIYKAVNAVTPKQQLDTRKKVEKILDYHRDGKITTPLFDYTVSNAYDQSGNGLKDAAAKTIELQYKGDNGE